MNTLLIVAVIILLLVALIALRNTIRRIVQLHQRGLRYLVRKEESQFPIWGFGKLNIIKYFTQFIISYLTLIRN